MNKKYPKELNNFINILFNIICSIFINCILYYVLNIFIKIEITNILNSLSIILLLIIGSIFLFFVFKLILRKIVILKFYSFEYLIFSLITYFLIMIFECHKVGTYTLIYFIISYLFIVLIFFCLSNFRVVSSSKIKTTETKYVYKYLKLNEYAIDDIENEHIYLSYASALNDSYEADFSVTDVDKKKCFNLLINYYCFEYFLNKLVENKISLRKWEKHYLNYILMAQKFLFKHNYSDIIFNFYKLYKKSLNYDESIEKRVEKEFDERVIPAFKEMSNDLLIGSFSKKMDSVLMWSHYADCHKGICLEIENNLLFRNVKYTKKKISFFLEDIIRNNIILKRNVDINFIKKINSYYFIKSDEWNYENEVRYVDYKNIVGSQFLKVKIRRILVGSKVDEKSEDFIKLKEIAKEKKIPICLMKNDNNYYRIIEDKQLL